MNRKQKKTRKNKVKKQRQTKSGKKMDQNIKLNKKHQIQTKQNCVENRKISNDNFVPGYIYNSIQKEQQEIAPKKNLNKFSFSLHFRYFLFYYFYFLLVLAI